MRYSIFFSAIVLFFCSCAGDSKRYQETIKLLNDGLVQSTKAITNNNIATYHAFDQKLHDQSYYNVEKWQQKAEQVRLVSDSVVQYINELKDKFQNDSGPNSKILNSLTDERNDELYMRLINYRKSILSIDSALTNEFKTKFKLFSGEFDTAGSNNKEFINTFLIKNSTLEIIASLNRFESNIRVNENDFITFFLGQIHESCRYFSSFCTIIGQSVNTVKGGDYIELTGGVGYFSTEAKPVMKVNGISVECNSDGISTYKLKSLTKVGKHIIPVAIEYIDQHNAKESKIYEIEYTVIDPNQK